MRKLYLLVGNGPIDKKSLDSALDMAEGEISNFLIHNDHLVSFEAPDSFALQLNDILLPLHDDLGISMTALACHRDDELERKLLRNALAFSASASASGCSQGNRQNDWGVRGLLPGLMFGDRSISCHIIHLAMVHLSWLSSSLPFSRRMYSR